MPMSLLRPTWPLPHSPHLSHGHCTLFSEGVVIQVDDSQQGVDGEGLGQGCDPRVVNSILWHVNFFQSPDDLQGRRELAVWTDAIVTHSRVVREMPPASGKGCQGSQGTDLKAKFWT